jgi:polyferredoxin
LTLYALVSREPFDLHVQHNRNPLFVRLTDGGVRNNFTVKILNKTNDDKHFSLQVQGLEHYTIKIEGAGHVVAEDLPVLANSVAQFRILLTVPDTEGMPQRSALRFVLTEAGSAEQDQTDSMFIIRE